MSGTRRGERTLERDGQGPPRAEWLRAAIGRGGPRASAPDARRAAPPARRAARSRAAPTLTTTSVSTSARATRSGHVPAEPRRVRVLDVVHDTSPWNRRAKLGRDEALDRPPARPPGEPGGDEDRLPLVGTPIARARPTPRRSPPGAGSRGGAGDRAARAARRGSSRGRRAGRSSRAARRRAGTAARRGRRRRRRRSPLAAAVAVRSRRRPRRRPRRRAASRRGAGSVALDG